jgi:hypothetical protein
MNKVETGLEARQVRGHQRARHILCYTSPGSQHHGQRYFHSELFRSVYATLAGIEIGGMIYRGRTGSRRGVGQEDAIRGTGNNSRGGTGHDRGRELRNERRQGKDDIVPVVEAGE